MENNFYLFFKRKEKSKKIIHTIAENNGLTIYSI